MFTMNTQRAKEIAASPEMAHVMYNDMPVYIQNVDEDRESARIYPLDEPQNEQDVPVASLKEK